MKLQRHKGAMLTLLTITLAAVALAQQSSAPASNVPALPADIPAEAQRWSVLSMGILAGQQATWTTRDGKLHAFFQFNDRGRGPKTTTVFSIDAQGLPTSEITEGNDYLKADVHEEFALSAGSAHWKSKAEEGQKKASGPSFYVSIYGPPEESAMLVRAALAHQGRLALLPEGVAGVKSVGERDVEVGRKKQHVTIYAVTGLDFSPNYVWLDSSRQFFAAGERWSMVIREGWESAQDVLLKAQDEINQQRAREIAKKLAHRSDKGVLFQHANVFDSEAGTILADKDVLVRGNKIASVQASKKTDATTRQQIEVIDATSKTLIPGLWDMHAHVSANDGLAQPRRWRDHCPRFSQ